MSISFKPLRAVLLGVAVLAASLVSGTGVASAAPATWSASGSYVSLQGDLTLTRAGYQTATCPNFTLTGGTGGSVLAGTILNNTCSNASTTGVFRMSVYATAAVNGGNYTLTFPTVGTWSIGIMGAYNGGSQPLPFINGSGSTPSRVVLNNSHLGSGVFATGTLAVKQHPSGALVTLN